MKQRRSVLTVTAVVLAVLSTAILLLAVGPPTGAPGLSSTGRRGLTDDEKRRVEGALGPEQGRSWVALQNFGVSTKLTQQELAYYRSRGTNEVFLLNWIAEYGITPEESEALRTVGVDMAIAHVPQANAYHWTAFADAVVLGRVERVVGNPTGPYHSHYQIAVTEYLKNCTPSSVPFVEGKLLGTGPRVHEGHVHQVERASEPNLEEGEKAVVFLSRTPLNLIALLQTPLDEPTRFGIEREHGRVEALVQLVEAPAGFEIVEAYKVVWGRAVQKIRTLHAASETEVVDIAVFKDKIREIAAVQEPFCRKRSIPAS